MEQTTQRLHARTEHQYSSPDCLNQNHVDNGDRVQESGSAVQRTTYGGLVRAEAVTLRLLELS